MPSLSSESLETTNSPYINRFLQPDTVIPDPSNPQGWNRYSYVTNRPVNFNDPTGHKMTTDTPGEGGKCDMECLLDIHHKDDKKADKSCKDSSCKRHNEDDDIYNNINVGYLLENYPGFDPFTTTTSVEPSDYPFSELEGYDVALLELYQSRGIDLDYYAKRRLPNPLSIDQVPSELQIRILGPVKSIELGIFLDEMDLGTSGNQMNYEPNYVFSLMSQNPRVLLNAINRYNTEVAPLTEHMYDLGPPGAD